MKYEYILNRIGDQVKLPFDEEGTAYCPICGDSLEHCLAYYPCGSPSEEICQSCNIQFGDDDVPTAEYKDLSTEEYFDIIRKQWLGRFPWKQEKVNQLINVLGIDPDRLRKMYTKHHTQNHLGEACIMYRDPQGDICCPVCGIVWEDTSDWGFENFLASLDVCPCCSTQFFLDDYPGVPTNPDNPPEKRWTALRTAWLNKVDWPDQAAAQLKNNLDLDVSK